MDEKIIWAVKNGDLESLKKLSPDPNITINGSPILVTAADYGQPEIIKYLLKNGALVNKPSTHGITPILAAIWEDHVDVVQILLQNGATKSGTCPDGTSYLSAATSDAVKNLLK